MNSKDKAKELVEKFYVPNVLIHDISWASAKEFAIIAVNEILDSRPSITDSQIEYQNYWQQVKEEINNL